jgi:hypothetical protein
MNSLKNIKEGDTITWITTVEHLIEDAVPVTDRVIYANETTFVIPFVNDRNRTIQYTFSKIDGMSFCGTRKVLLGE